MSKTDDLIAAFGKSIAQGDFAPGAALPSEAELCTRFGTSRNIMREVIKVLSTKRLIDAKAHRGLFVAAQKDWHFLDPDVLSWVLEKEPKPALILSLLEVRCLIEPVISRWAAERARSVDLVAIEEALSQMTQHAHLHDEANLNFSLFNKADIAFHHAILDAAHNVVMNQLSNAISSLQRTIFILSFSYDKTHMESTLLEHADLFDAIRKKDALRAETLSRDMIERTAQRARTTFCSVVS